MAHPERGHGEVTAVLRAARKEHKATQRRLQRAQLDLDEAEEELREDASAGQEERAAAARRAVTEATWSGMTAAGVTVLILSKLWSSGILSIRMDSSIHFCGYPLPRIGRLVEWLGRLGDVRKDIGSSPVLVRCCFHFLCTLARPGGRSARRSTRNG